MWTPTRHGLASPNHTTHFRQLPVRLRSPAAARTNCLVCSVAALVSTPLQSPLPIQIYRLTLP